MMRRPALTALAAALLAAGAGAPRTWAQPSEEAAPSGPEPGMAEDAGPDAAPADVPDRIAKRLGLSDEQAAKLKTAVAARRDAAKATAQQTRDGLKKLREQLRAKAPDADVQATLETLKAARKSSREAEDKFVASLESFLTPTQRAKLLFGALMRRRGEHRGGRRGGGEPPGGDGGREAGE